MTSPQSVFISISLVSNRPDTFRALLDNFEQTAFDPSRVEIIVRIDDGDDTMQKLVRDEQSRRRLKLKFLSAPFTGFLDLYKSFDEMHYKLCDPNAYFVQHINDELRHVIPNWDKTLEERYTGLFADNIYRLRLSAYKLWTYHSIEECAPHPENIPIVTKKWIDLTGWCPCHSADSFQQMLAYYLSKADDGNDRFTRDIPIFDIEMAGLEAGAGLVTPEEIANYDQRAKEAWSILFSDEMQLQAQKKANVLRAHIKAHRLGITDLSIEHSGEATHVFDAKTNREMMTFPLAVPSRKPTPDPTPLEPLILPQGRAIPLCIRAMSYFSRFVNAGRRLTKLGSQR